MIEDLDRNLSVVYLLSFCSCLISIRRVVLLFFVLKGTILLAVNPLKSVPIPSIEDFKDQSLDPEMPHPYAIAEVCYLVIWYGVVWYRVIWYGVVWCGVVWCC